MWSSRLLLPFLLLPLAFGQSSQDRLRLGPVYVKTPEHLELLVELPQGVAAGANDVQLMEDGEPTIRASALTKFRESGWSLGVVLAMDMSRSLPNRDLEEAKSALKNFASQLKDPLALITFADEPSVVGSFETPREEMINSISTIRLGGKHDPTVWRGGQGSGAFAAAARAGAAANHRAFGRRRNQFGTTGVHRRGDSQG